MTVDVIATTCTVELLHRVLIPDEPIHASVAYTVIHPEDAFDMRRAMRMCAPCAMDFRKTHLVRSIRRPESPW